MTLRTAGLAAVFPAARASLRVGSGVLSSTGFAVGEVARGPAVVRRGIGVDGELKERVFRQLVAEVIVAHVGGEECAAIEYQGFAAGRRRCEGPALRGAGLLAVGIHADD